VFKFITDRPLWANVLAGIIFFFLIIFLMLQLLGAITKHGQYLTVPAVVGKKTSDAVAVLESKGFEVIYDSVYTDTAQKGIVLKQIPEPNSTVKVNRTVKLTVNRVTLPLVEMPSLQGKTLNFALEILRRSHLTLGDTIFKPDFMMGSVLEQNFNGTVIPPGAKLPWGSKIDLIVGSGLTEDKLIVPDLVGLTYESAKLILDSSGILLGAIVPDPGITDTMKAFIWKQSPPRLNDFDEPVYIQPGQIMDLWISPVMKTVIDSQSVKKNKP
jgi:beta-lactam-binding protein with PASTA domain